MTRPPKDLGASIRARLLNLQRAGGMRFETLLVAYGLERLLYRLSVSDSREAFVLKGGVLVSAWMPGARFTRDIDFLGEELPDETALRHTFADLMRADQADGLVFDTDGLVAKPIRVAHAAGRVRLVARATLDGARVPITIDVGFGDAMATAPELMTYPTLLDMPAPRVRAYAVETVLAEKLHAVVTFAGTSTRIKDVYDLWQVPKARTVDQGALARSLVATFARHGTALPEERPAGLARTYGESRDRRTQWRQYLFGIRMAEVPLIEVLDEIWRVIEPAVARARSLSSAGARAGKHK